MAKAVVDAALKVHATNHQHPGGESGWGSRHEAPISQLMCKITADDALDLSYATPPSEDVRGLGATFTEGGSSPSPFGEGHQPTHFFPETNYMGLVTRTIPANSPDFHSPKRKAAIKAEISDLRSEGVWDEQSVAEWTEVKHIKKDGHSPMCGLRKMPNSSALSPMTNARSGAELSSRVLTCSLGTARQPG